MKLERRALLAFVCSMLLFLAYDAFYLSPKLEKQRERRAAEAERLRQQQGDSLSAALPAVATEVTNQTEGIVTEQTPALTSAEPTPGTPDLSGQAQDTMPPRAEITIVSPLYEITLTTAGAEIVSVKLPGYTTGDLPVELIPQNPDWPYARAVNTSLVSQTSVAQLHTVQFEAFRDGGGAAVLDGTTVNVDERKGETEIVFRAPDRAGGTIERYYKFFVDRYYFETGVRFTGASFPDVSAVTWGLGEGLATTETNVKDDLQNFKANILLGQDVHGLRPADFGNKSSEQLSGTLSWVALRTKYFAAVFIPKEPTRSEIMFSGDKAVHRISAEITLPTTPGRGVVDQSIRVYMGPLDYKRLKSFGIGLERNVEMGWRLIRPVSWVVLWSMTWLYKYIPNYGVVILIISVLTKVLFYRLTHKSFKSMKDLQALQPKMQALKEKYKEDRQKLSQETMKLYKEAGVNPLGGCLPLVLQMPVFIALFNVLKFTIEVRGAHFVAWINDLSQQDVLFKLPLSLPLIGDNFSLLPILMGASMFLQTKIGGSITPGSPNSSTPPGFQTMLPIVFTFLFYKMPSGLVLYWIVNTVLSIAQQYYINKDTGGGKPEKNGGEKTAKASKRRLKTKER